MKPTYYLLLHLTCFCLMKNGYTQDIKWNNTNGSVTVTGTKTFRTFVATTPAEMGKMQFIQMGSIWSPNVSQIKGGIDAIVPPVQGEVILKIYAVDALGASPGQSKLIYGCQSHQSGFFEDSWNVTVPDKNLGATITTQSSNLKRLATAQSVFVPSDCGGAGTLNAIDFTLFNLGLISSAWVAQSTPRPPAYVLPAMGYFATGTVLTLYNKLSYDHLCKTYLKQEQPVMVELTVTNSTVNYIKIPGNETIITPLDIFCISELSTPLGKNREKFLNPTLYPGMMVAAHRGYWNKAPENSIASINAAINFGADMIEVHVAQTRDKVLVLLHDQTLERTTTIEDHPDYKQIIARPRPGSTAPAKEAYLSNVDFNELMQTNPNGEHYVKLKDRHGNVYRDSLGNYQTIPMLDDVLKNAKSKILVNLDKADRYFYECWDAIQAYGVAPQTITKGYLSIGELKAKYKDADGSNTKLGKIMDGLIYTPIANDKLAYDHLDRNLQAYPVASFSDLVTSVKGFMQDYLSEKDQYGMPWADGYEPNPESLNSPVLPLIGSMAQPNNRRVGAFAAYADLGWGHAINKGRWKFDPPFELRNNFELSVDNGINYIITDRTKLLKDFADAIEKPSPNRTFVDLSKAMPPKISDTSTRNNGVLVATHRAGDGTLGPENSLVSIQNCIDAGVSIIEIDVGRSASGTYYVFHDRYLEKMTNASELLNTRPDTFTTKEGKKEILQYPIFKYTDAEINHLKLRVRDRKTGAGTRISDQPIPTLAQVLDLVKGKILIRVDKWDDATYRKNNVREICQLLNEKGMLNQAIFSGSGSMTADIVKQWFGAPGNSVDLVPTPPGAPYFYDKIIFAPVIDINSTIDKIDAWLHSEINTPIFRFRVPPPSGTYTANDVDAVVALIKYVNTLGKWTYIPASLPVASSQSGGQIDNPTGWENIFRWGATCIETNNPMELIRFIYQKNLCTTGENRDKTICPFNPFIN